MWGVASRRPAWCAVVATFATSGLLTGAWAPRVPQVKDALDLGTGALGLALLAPAAGALVTMPLAGAGAARWGSARMTRWLLIVFCLLAGTVGTARALWSLALALFCWGGAGGALDVVMNAQGVGVEKAGRRPVMSGFHAAFSIGALIGAALGSAAAAWHVPVSAQQLVLGLALLVVGWPMTRAFLPDPPDQPDPPGGGTTRPARIFALPSGSMVNLGAAAFCCLLCEGAASDWSAVHLRESLGASAGVAGTAFAGFSLAMAAGRLVGDRITARLGRMRTVRAFAALGTVGLAAGMATGSVAGAVVGFCLLGAGLSCLVPVLFATAGRGPGGAGPAIASVATCGYLGWMIGPTLLGGLAQAVGLPTALWLLPVLTGAAGVLASTPGEPTSDASGAPVAGYRR